jgi:hypothetical protein
MFPAFFNMTKYYFDLRDDQGITVDDEGLELDSIDLVQAEAVRSLADMARKGSFHAEVAVEVREGDGLVLLAKLTRLRR